MRRRSVSENPREQKTQVARAARARHPGEATRVPTTGASARRRRRVPPAASARGMRARLAFAGTGAGAASMRQKRDPRRCRAPGRDRRCDGTGSSGGARGVATRGGHARVAADIGQMSGRLAPCSLTRLKRVAKRESGVAGTPSSSRGLDIGRKNSRPAGSVSAAFWLLSPTDLPTPNRETRLESHPSASVIPASALLIGRDRDDGRRGVRGAPSLSVGDQERRGRVGRGHHR